MRLLSRRPGLRALRAWGSAAAQTGQCRARRVGREQVEALKRSRVTFPSCVCREGREDTEPTGQM